MSDSKDPMVHESVMLNEVLDLMAVKCGGTYIDGTVGSGGHLISILNQIGSEGVLLGIDQDVEALERTRTRIKKECTADIEKQCLLEHGNFAEMDEIAHKKGINEVDGILLDIGVSSEQLNEAERGFSFMHDGPLDMRMDQSCGITAAEVVMSHSESDLKYMIKSFGEERQAGRVARAIVREREKAPISTTKRLADIVEQSLGGRRSARHPATKTFQALRMYVNREIDVLEKGLNEGLNMLAEGGRMGVITFHSIEDRIVKKFFASHVGRWESLAAGGSEWVGERPVMKHINKKPVMASEAEVKKNPRSRSAKLRVAERLTEKV